MAESTLSVTRAELLRYIGREKGWSRDPGEWDERQSVDGDDILNRALRMFYNPAPLPGEGHSHRWSFLRPIFNITTATGTGDYDLPDDFGGIEGKLFFGNELVGNGALIRVGEQWILSNRQGNLGLTGYPKYFAIAPLAGDGDEGQRFMLMLDPTPDDAYELRGQYRVNPFQTTDSKPYPLGGQPHSETLVAAVLAACESTLGDTMGVRKAEFIERLQASVSHDRQEMGPRNLGYSYGYGGDQPIFRNRALAVHFEGELWDG